MISSCRVATGHAGEAVAATVPEISRRVGLASSIHSAKNLKELRPGSSGRSEVRVLFAFDPARRAIMLVAGDKAGNWQRWYRKNIRSRSSATATISRTCEGGSHDEPG